MSALSILSMNYTTGQNELDTTHNQTGERSHYWKVERKTKHGWKFLVDFMETKSGMARLWMKFYHGNKSYRLRHITAY